MRYCQNCGSSFDKNYCNSCGQKYFSKADKSIKNLFEELFHFLTHFEGSFFTSIKAIFFHPSKLSFDYCNGIRKKYFKPVSLYIFVVILYLLIPVATGLNMKMQHYKHNLIGKNLINTQIEAKVKQLGITEDELAVIFDSKSDKTAKFLLLGMIPLTAAFIYFFFYHKGALIYDTVILSTELNIFFISVYYLLLPILLLLSSLVFPSLQNPDDNIFVITLYVGSFFIYLTTLFYRFYKQKLIITIPKTIVFVFLFNFFIISIYKFLIFETVMLFL